MGYNTEFIGQVELDKTLILHHYLYLLHFSRTRRMKRNAACAEGLTDVVRLLAELPIGEEGGYFVGGTGLAGQDRDISIVDYNKPPEGQPNLWCQWTPTIDGKHLKWNEHEKFYDYVQWLQYLITHFLRPWGYVLNGRVSWRGEIRKDRVIIS